MNEYAPSKEDLEGGGERSAKPRGKYTAKISRSIQKPDRKGNLSLRFGLAISKGKFKTQLLFENYLPLTGDLNKVNKFQRARRNSFFKAIGLNPGEIPPGAPGGPKPEVLDGTIVDINVEHEYENVPGEDYSITTSPASNKKSRWVDEGWEARLNEKGQLVRDGSDNIILGDDGEPEPISPRETLTWYDVSNDFTGVGGDTGSESSSSEGDAASDTDGWG